MGGERCGICGHMAEVGDCAAPSTLPSELVPGFLFLGSYDHASRADLLKTLGITHILNVTHKLYNQAAMTALFTPNHSSAPFRPSFLLFL